MCYSCVRNHCVSGIFCALQSSDLAACTDNQFIFPPKFQDRHFIFNNRRRIEHNYLESFENYDKEEEVGEEVVNEVGYCFITFNES